VATTASKAECRDGEAAVNTILAEKPDLVFLDLRIHRSTILNVHRIKEIHPWFHGYYLVLLENGQELRMSRYQREVANQLGLV
jgi:LytTr DNA-binding domain-containing protein